MVAQALPSIYRPVCEFRSVDALRAKFLCLSQREAMDKSIEEIFTEVLSAEAGNREMEGTSHRSRTIEDSYASLNSKDGAVSVHVTYGLGRPCGSKSPRPIEYLRFQLDFLSQNPEDAQEYERLKRVLRPNGLRVCNETLA